MNQTQKEPTRSEQVGAIVCGSLTVLIILLILIRCFYKCSKRRNHSQSELVRRNHTRARKESVIITLRDIEGGHDVLLDGCEETCAICLDRMDQNSEIRVTLCQHKFHLDCLTKWSSKQKTCPICRRNITQPLV